MKNACVDLVIDLLINNKEVSTQNYVEIRDPGNLTDIVGKVAVGTEEDVDNAVNVAHKAFLNWRNCDVKNRKEYMLMAAKVLEDSMQELVTLLVREHGGALWEAQTDFYLGISTLRYYSSIMESFLQAEQTEDETGWIRIEKTAKGVVGAIVPWNMPVVLTMMKLAPALAMGNSIVIKPSPTAPLAISILLKKIAEVFPQGVINVVHGDANVGIALTRHPLVNKVAFTGGTKTGQEVMRNVSGSFKAITLELGGNDPAIVLDDVNPEDIIPKLLKGVYTRSGQICFAIKRIYVPESMIDKFFNTFCEYVNEYKVGHGLDKRTSFGPLNNLNQYKFVNELIKKTKSCGLDIKELGTKLEPDSWDNGYYVLPHVVKAFSNAPQIVNCEQFGPIVPIIAYKTMDQAVEMANESEYGLCSSVWSRDPLRALGVARRIEAGSTFINTHSFESLSLGMPFGGVKSSGIGRELAGSPTLSAYVDYHSIRYVK